MKVVEISAKTIEEAVELGLQQLNLTKDEVEYEVLEYPTKGILGIMAKPAKILIREKFIPVKEVKKFLDGVLKEFNINYSLEVDEYPDFIKAKITGDDLAILIGKHGKTIDALQYLLSLSINKKTEEYIKVILDVNGYRDKRELTLEALAIRQAERAKKYKKKIVLEPMNAMERRIIHSVLNDDPEVETYSEGEEPNRRVVIEPIG
ncbi:spoIIIJ-associated protein [Anaerobranca californiensis DSM 14826]|jgi:spoIIIJ-associated protein|uniref:RNA-binding protein KhpB n=1 Tax=Anaerobranca californiensis DSM 14826 TaxID=1120989 RepID=A0A1M6M249_9FIRM|nr:RNA-binding cell elongation regulator Jag/EloR [Anaerobranca californiensis]SHJ77529.1 spoIIIJ-associated protein [Anaerobranca californiensis DSM 14826]